MKLFRFSWLKLLASILISLVLILAFLVGTQSGSRWLLNTVMSQINGRMVQVEGTIWSGIRSQELEVTTPALKIVAKDAALAVNWLSLLRARLQVEHLTTTDLNLELFPTEPKVEESASSELVLPISIQVDKVSVGQFTMTDASGKNLPVGLNNFDVESLLLDSSGVTTADLQRLTVTHPDVTSELSGTVELEKLAYPWPMHVSLNTSNTGSHTQSPLCVDYLLGRSRDVRIQTSCQVDAQAQIDGGLDGMSISLAADGVGQGLDLDIEAGLNIESSIPLTKAIVDLQVAKDMRLHTEISSELEEVAVGAEGETKQVVSRLVGKVTTDKFILDMVQADSRLDSDLDFIVDFNEQTQLQTLALKGGIYRGSRWGGEALNAGININADFSDVFVENGITAWESLQLANADILMTLGDNTIESKGQFLDTDQSLDGLQLDVELLDLSQLVNGMAGEAEVKLNMLGNLKAHDIKASVKYVPQVEDVDSLTPSELAKAQYGLGKEPFTMHVDLVADLKSAEDLYDWQADLDRLYLEHAGFIVEQKDSLHLSLQQTVSDFLLEIGQTELALTLPGEHQGSLLHKKTSVTTTDGWSTEGQFSDLIIDNRLLQLLGLEENVAASLAALQTEDLEDLTAEEQQSHQQAIADVQSAIEVKKQITPIAYDGDWSLQGQPALAGTVNLKRHSGSTILPLEHPLPLDLADISIELGSSVEEEIGQMLISARGEGENSTLNAELSIENGFALAVKKATIGLGSVDGGSLNVEVDTANDTEREHVQIWSAELEAQDFNLSAFSLGHLPDESLLSIQGGLNATVMQRNQILQLQPDLAISPESSWNHHELSGQIRALVDLSGVFALAQQVELDQSLAAPKWYQLKLEGVDTQLSLGDSSIVLAGDLGAEDDELTLNAQIPELAYWWPELPGQVSADLLFKGDPSQHSLDLNFLYDSFLASDTEEQPLLFNLSLDGEVLFENATPQSWQLAVSNLDASYADLALATQQPVVVDLNLLTDKQQFSWEVGESELTLSYPDGRQSLIHHQYSQGQSQYWQTQGSLTDMIASMGNYEYVLAMVDALSNKKLLSTAALEEIAPEDELVFDGAWDFKQEEQLSGSFNLERKHTSGLWPFPTPVPLDFDRLSVQVDDGADAERTADYIVNADGMNIQASGEGPNSYLDANVYLHPASPFMLEQAQVNLTLADESTLNAHVFTGTDGAYLENTRLYGLVQTSGIPLDKVSYGAIPPGMINGDVHFNVILSEENQPRQAFVTGEFADDSRWNSQPLQGSLDFGLFFQDEHNFRIAKADIDLRLGQSQIHSEGAFGESGDSLVLSVKAPQLNDLWPDLPGSVDLELSLDGSIAENSLSTKGRFSQGDFSEVGKAPIDFELRAAGGWHVLTEEGYEGWAGTLDFLDVRHAGFAVTQAEPLELSLIPQGADSKPQWDVGASTVGIVLPGDFHIALEQGGSQGKEGRFDTSGAIRGLAFSPNLIENLQEAFGIELGGGQSINHGIIVRGREEAVANPPVFDFVWDLDFDEALRGSANLVNLGGDFIIPSDPPVALGLEKMELSINSQPQEGALSVLTADLELVTESKGSVQGNASLTLDGFSPVFDNNTQARVVGHMDDISWLTGLTGDLVELGGRVDLDVTANYRGGNWVTSGGVKAEELRIVEVENGIRLLDGSLDLGLNGNDVVINRLHFPSVIRIIPNEWRTRQWIEENPPAQSGSLDITGNWNLQSSRGQVNVLFDHYPIMQRTDRFAMISGEVNVDAALPRIVVGGKVTADAGWVSVDIKGTAPTVDSDVVVIRKGEELPQASPSSLDLDLNFTVDLGPRFYVVGFGLDAGLVGAITIMQANNVLSAEGQFNTRGGAIEAYGQRLQIRRGRIAFQGDITNPVLDIEALRRNLEVEAGLRVVGNARNPKISLISYPEVSEAEKLSWLIMGRGPDSGGGDLAMLLTVGTSFLGGDGTSEPLHQQLGIDDIAIRKGDVGESGSVLPQRTVGDSTSYLGQNDISEQFLLLSKQLKRGINLSIEQALSGSGTVGRVSYNLIRNLTIDAKVGTVSGVEMVYRRFFRD